MKRMILILTAALAFGFAGFPTGDSPIYPNPACDYSMQPGFPDACKMA